MYSVQDLEKNEYFAEILKNTAIENILDPLTGLITRNVFSGYVEELIKKNQEFALCIIDLDNFKMVNDNYGHHIGDLVLIDISETLRKYMGDDGIVARYGGDEFIFTYQKEVSYDAIHKFFEDFYRSKVLRRNLLVGGINIFMTATTGCATYPYDGKNYDDLFAKADKTLYRGKFKGRNCFIIYVEDKHKDIDVKKMISSDLYTIFYNLNNKFENATSELNKFRNSVIYLKSEKKFSTILYVNKNNDLIDLETSINYGKINLSQIMASRNLYSTNATLKLKEIDKDVYLQLKHLNIQSLLIQTIKKRHNIYGYLIMAESRINRLWQPEDEALLFFFSTLIANYFNDTK